MADCWLTRLLTSRNWLNRSLFFLFLHSVEGLSNSASLTLMEETAAGDMMLGDVPGEAGGGLLFFNLAESLRWNFNFLIFFQHWDSWLWPCFFLAILLYENKNQVITSVGITLLTSFNIRSADQSGEQSQQQYGVCPSDPPPLPFSSPTPPPVSCRCPAPWNRPPVCRSRLFAPSHIATISPSEKILE